MPTKAELSDEINEVLGTNMEWDRMLEEDLRLYHELVMNGGLLEPVTKQYIKQHGKKQFENQVDNWYPGKYATRIL